MTHKRKPLLLDLFCGGGGASMGYYRAGFDVVGVDIEPQKHYPFDFVRADAMTYPLAGFNAIHASPPCQLWCALKEFATPDAYPDLLVPVYDRLAASGKPFVIENSDRAPMCGAIVLCGSMFGLSIRRHRAFWSSHLLMLPGPCQHTGRELVFARTPKETQYRAAMGIDWMSARRARQAIPPAYTQWIGRQLLVALGYEARKARVTA